MCFVVWDNVLLKADLKCSGRELRGKPVDIRKVGRGRCFPLLWKNNFLTITNPQP